MNFLEIAEKTRKWSGTSSATIGAVTGLSGQSALIVDAVGIAWDTIQTKHQNWRWLRNEFSAPITAIVAPTEARYNAAALGLTRLASFVDDNTGAADAYKAFSIYLTATGRADESQMTQISFQAWKDKYGRGVQTSGKPTEWCEAPDGQLCLGKAPDGPYTLKGESWKSPQTMALTTDVPEMPAEFHMAIVHQAVLLLHEKDEADSLVYSRSENHFTAVMGRLEARQLPTISIGGRPLA